MILVDANILIYAINSSARQHEPARRWLEGALSDGAELGFPWIVLLAFLRITTHRAILEKPLKVETALKLVDSWIDLVSVALAWRLFTLAGNIGKFCGVCSNFPEPG